jgi:hypothetical protein
MHTCGRVVFDVVRARLNLSHPRERVFRNGKNVAVDFKNVKCGNAAGVRRYISVVMWLLVVLKQRM